METIDIQNIHPTKRTFRDLAIGDTFDFVNMSQPMWNSFYRRCVKISTRKYQAIDEPKTIYRVGSISAKVYHVASELHAYEGLGNTICEQCGHSLNHPIHTR